MKITFDSENFLQSSGIRKFVCVLLFIVAAALIFHLGVVCGSHRNFHHHTGKMRSQQQFFTTETLNDADWQIPGGGQNAVYYTNREMMGGYGSAPAMRITGFDQGDEVGQCVMYYQDQ